MKLISQARFLFTVLEPRMKEPNYTLSEFKCTRRNDTWCDEGNHCDNCTIPGNCEPCQNGTYDVFLEWEKPDYAPAPILRYELRWGPDENTEYPNAILGDQPNHMFTDKAKIGSNNTVDAVSFL